MRISWKLGNGYLFDWPIFNMSLVFINFQAGAGCLGTEEAEINAILCIKSYDQLRSIFYKYEELKGNPLEEDIASETSGTLKDGFLAIGKTCWESEFFLYTYNTIFSPSQFAMFLSEMSLFVYVSWLCYLHVCPLFCSWGSQIQTPVFCPTITRCHGRFWYQRWWPHPPHRHPERGKSCLKARTDSSLIRYNVLYIFEDMFRLFINYFLTLYGRSTVDTAWNTN